MRILLLDNGSPYLATLTGLLRGHAVEVLGFPFAAEAFRAALEGKDRVIHAGDASPAGIALPYRKRVLAEIAAASVPVFGIEQGAALLLEAHGGKVKTVGGRSAARKAPPGWEERDGVWRSSRGDVAAFAPGDRLPALIDAFLAHREA